MAETWSTANPALSGSPAVLELRQPDTTIPRARLCNLLDRNERLTIVRAPMGFGKSVLISQWITRWAATTNQIARVNADELASDSASFWSRCIRAVHEVTSRAKSGRAEVFGQPLADLPNSDSSQGLACILRRLDRQLTLVIDSFDRIRDPRITYDLMGIALDVDLLRLVIVGRSTGGVERMSGSRLSVGLISERDLVFSANETAGVLRSAVPDISDSDLHVARRATRGWPLPVEELARILSDSYPNGSIESSSEIAISRACRDVEMAVGDVDSRRIGCLSMIEAFPHDLAVSLLQEGTAVSVSSSHVTELLECLERNGLLSLVVDVGPSWSWSALVREVVFERFVSHSPELATRIVRVLAEWCHAHGDDKKALIYCARSGQTEKLLEVFETHPVMLLSPQPDEVRLALTSPRTEVTRRESTVLARSLVLGLPVDDQALAPPERFSKSEVDELADSSTARSSVEKQLCLVNLYRRECMFDRAAAADQNARSVLQAMMVKRTSEIAGLRSFALIESATLRGATGDTRGAIDDLIEAYSQSGICEFPHVAADACALLGMYHSIQGDEKKATTWLLREATELLSSRTANARRITGLIAAAVTAASTLQEEECSGALCEIDSLGEEAYRSEFWALIAYARARYALIWGDRLNAVDELSSSWVPSDLWHRAKATGGAATSLLSVAKAELLMALGRGNDARATMRGLAASDPNAAVARARLALLSGEDSAALAIAGSVSGHRMSEIEPTGFLVRASPRHRLESMVIRSIACQRLGMSETAEDLLVRAVNRAEQLGSFYEFAVAPREDLISLADRVPSASRMIATLGSTPAIYPRSINVITLTEREKAILEGLESGLDIRRIASSGYVSINTVKTQLRMLYRKLDVCSREQAVLVATDLHLLPPKIEPAIESLTAGETDETGRSRVSGA